MLFRDRRVGNASRYGLQSLFCCKMPHCAKQCLESKAWSISLNRPHRGVSTSRASGPQPYLKTVLSGPLLWELLSGQALTDCRRHPLFEDASWLQAMGLEAAIQGVHEDVTREAEERCEAVRRPGSAQKQGFCVAFLCV